MRYSGRREATAEAGLREGEPELFYTNQLLIRTTGDQFRIDTPGCVKDCIIPDNVLFVNGMPLVVVEAKLASATEANPMYEAFVQQHGPAEPDPSAQRPIGGGNRRSSRRSVSSVVLSGRT
jgi:hypothetical protein